MSGEDRERLGRSREPAVAGTFYAGDPARLERDVRALLDEVSLGLVALDAAAADAPAADSAAADSAANGSVLEAIGRDERVVGLLVPHAGLAYSGGVAAIGWSTLARHVAQDPEPPTILLAGTNHFHPFTGVAVWSGGPWRIPFGDVAVDRPWSDALLGLGSPFVALDRAHGREHSIEVQLPILSRCLPGTRFVPFLVSLGDLAACIDAGRRLGRLIAQRSEELGPVVIVASSDLAHYPTDDVARRVDLAVLEPIAAIDPGELAARELEVRDAGLPGVACGLCGIEPTLATLAAVAEIGAARGIVLAHATSADVPDGDPGRVVGYAAVAFVSGGASSGRR